MALISWHATRKCWKIWFLMGLFPCSVHCDASYTNMWLINFKRLLKHVSCWCFSSTLWVFKRLNKCLKAVDCATVVYSMKQFHFPPTSRSTSFRMFFRFYEQNKRACLLTIILMATVMMIMMKTMMLVMLTVDCLLCFCHLNASHM